MIMMFFYYFGIVIKHHTGAANNINSVNAKIGLEKVKSGLYYYKKYYLENLGSLKLIYLSLSILLSPFNGGLIAKIFS